MLASTASDPQLLHQLRRKAAKRTLASAATRTALFSPGLETLHERPLGHAEALEMPGEILAQDGKKLPFKLERQAFLRPGEEDPRETATAENQDRVLRTQ
ncbi:MAG: hypothetical protein HY721_15155 [Planctomycetes bacterium]|nr:hypothetical protein [Planctomycetota bacterium]